MTNEETVTGEVVDEKEINWGSEFGDIGFEVWKAGTYKLVRVDE